MSKIAKLIIRDEVNVKFEGLDVITRRKISDKLKFFPGVYLFAKLGRWDGNIRFCDIEVEHIQTCWIEHSCY